MLKTTECWNMFGKHCLSSNAALLQWNCVWERWSSTKQHQIPNSGAAKNLYESWCDPTPSHSHESQNSHISDPLTWCILHFVSAFTKKKGKWREGNLIPSLGILGSLLLCWLVGSKSNFFILVWIIISLSL